MENNRKIYANVKSIPLGKIFKSPFTALLSYWIFQGMLYMDRTELAFKLGLDLLGTLIFTPFLKTFYSTPASLLLGFVLTHTINFLFNGQIWGALKFYGFVKNSQEKFERYTLDFANRVRENSSLKKALVFGSLSRHEWHETSDLDIRLLRKPGVINGLHACRFLLTERTRALFARFPIDAYVIDDLSSLSKLRSDEKGIDLLTSEVIWSSD
jgi:L-malate glycosyltransferase